MTIPIEFEIDDDTASLLGDTVEARNAVAREAVLLHFFSQGVISEERAASLLGMNVPDFLDHARSLCIPVDDQVEMEEQAEAARRRSA
jgi:hypothetical protein